MVDTQRKRCRYSEIFMAWAIFVLFIAVTVVREPLATEDPEHPVFIYGKEGARIHTIELIQHMINGDVDAALNYLNNPFYDCGEGRAYSTEDLKRRLLEQGKDEPINATMYTIFDMSRVRVYDHTEILNNETLQWDISEFGLQPGDYLVTMPYRTTEPETRGYSGIDPPVDGVWNYVRDTQRGWKTVAGD